MGMMDNQDEGKIGVFIACEDEFEQSETVEMLQNYGFDSSAVVIEPTPKKAVYRCA